MIFDGKEPRREYAGDGVYVVEDEHHGVWLYANDAVYPSDKVYLESEVLATVLRILKTWGYVDE